MNTELLIEYLSAKGKSAAEMAEIVGIDLSTWYRRLQRKGDSFTIKEMNAIIRACHMTATEAAQIFFNEKLA